MQAMVLAFKYICTIVRSVQEFAKENTNPSHKQGFSLLLRLDQSLLQLVLDFLSDLFPEVFVPP